MKHMDSTVVIDTRTENPYQVGYDLFEAAGGANLDSDQIDDSTAGDMAAHLTGEGVRLIDFDGDELDMAQYIGRYLERNAR